jgi:glycosyltransferase involved in cell wall biosynthesis
MQPSLKSKPKILLLSGYDAASHRYWRELLENQLISFEWTQLSLPDRYFSWRIRGSGLSFAFQYKEILEQDYDALIVTSMVDLAALRGFVPHLSSIPTLVYFHENQFAYPLKENQPDSMANQHDTQNRVSAQLTSIYTVLCADKVLFNSKYNQTTFLKGAQSLLKKLPDGVAKGLLNQVEHESQVLAVPISNNYFDQKSIKDNKVIEILWNHRWEYDKQPEVLFEALSLLKNSGVSFKLHCLGQSFRQVPNCFERAKKDFKDEIETWGYQSKEKYKAILLQADIVVSTAIHDFQGLSMLEAIASGCYPVAPMRVAYPEYILSENCYLPEISANEAQSLFNQLIKSYRLFESGVLNSNQSIAKVKCYSEQHLLNLYNKTINELINV